MSKSSIDSLSYAIELIDSRIEVQQQAADEWLIRVEFYEGEGWDDLTEQAGRILKRTIDELQRLRQHKEQLQKIKNNLISDKTVWR